MNQLTFIILSTTDWDAPQFGSRQQIARQLARRHQVLYVEQPRALHSLISDRRKTLVQMRRWLGGGLRCPIAGLPALQVYSPPPVLPVFYHALSNPLSQRILRVAIRRALKRLNWQADIFWTYWANSSYLVGNLGEQAAIYHCIDNFRASRYPLVSPAQIAALEEDLCQKVDLVITRTEGLARMLKPVSRRVEVIGGGVDTDLFDYSRSFSLPETLKGMPKPIAGLVGSLDDRIDVPLLQHAAQHLPQVTFVLAGFYRSHLVDLSPLLALPNVRLLPPVPHSDVPAYIAQFDVGLIPYLVNDFTREVSPLKLYEFLAMGKEVVATPLPYICREEALVRIAHSPGAFTTAIEQALSNPHLPETQMKRREAAYPHSWQRQSETIERLIQEVPALTPRPPLPSEMGEGESRSDGGEGESRSDGGEGQDTITE